MDNNKTSLFKKDGVNYIFPFILITFCFALWGFANDITNPMVKAFSKIFRMSVSDGALVQVAFYGGYFAMALPAAMFIKKFSYKTGILMGLALYCIGAFLFLPSKMIGSYYCFLIAYFILTCGLSFLQTSANPYILSMGPDETATRRLNYAQCFNPVGSLLGMYIAMNYIQAKLNPMSSSERESLDDIAFEALKQDDLTVLITPYLGIGLVICTMFLLIYFTKMPRNVDATHKMSIRSSYSRLFKNKSYREGIVAQFFYIGAQIMCWTFIIQYWTRYFMSVGFTEKEGEMLSQQYNIIAMIIFCCSRFMCTFLLKYFNPGRLLMSFAIAALILCCGVVIFTNIVGLYCLVLISACMSLMFPTIYGIALKGVGDDAKFGSAGLIMSILGGSVLTPIQARIIDVGTINNFPAVNISYLMPLLCFLVVAIYGYRRRI